MIPTRASTSLTASSRWYCRARRDAGAFVHGPPDSRPRDRKAINHNPHFKELRRQVVSFLLDSKGQHAAVSRKLILPDIEPEDLSWCRGR